MYGTIHLTIGAGIPVVGGHIELDGEVVQENAEWTF
jgi:hypothetical protein